MWGQQGPEPIEALLKSVQLGNVSDSVLQYMGDYIKNVVQRLTTQWVNSDVTQIKSDAAMIAFHESFRQAIRAHLLIETKMKMQKQEGRLSDEELNFKSKNGHQGFGVQGLGRA